MTERATAPKKLPGWVWGGMFGCVVIMSWMGWNKYGPVTAAERLRLTKRLGGSETLVIIQDAERVYATRIQVSGRKDSWKSLDDFEAIAEPLLLSERDKRQLQHLLLAPRNYVFEPAACRPRWGFRLRFLKEEKAMEVWVCLECRHLLFVRNGEEVGGIFLGRMANDIDALALQLFPGDEAIANAIEGSR